MTLPLSRVLFVVACVLFTVASLAAGGVVAVPVLAFGFGGFAAWVLALAV